MSTPAWRYFEQGVISPTPIEIELVGRFKGTDPATGDPIAGAITPGGALNPTVGSRPPVAGVITGSMPTATTADCAVDYTDPGDGRPPVLTWHWSRDGVEIGTSAEPTRTFHYPAVPNDGAVHHFTVRGESDDGIGQISNDLALQFGGAPQQAPTAPSGLARHNLTTAQVDLTWAELTDDPATHPAVLEHGIFEGNTLVKPGLDPGAVAYTWAVAAGSRHTNVNIRRRNSVGWSPASNQITFTVPTASVQHDVVMGSTVNDEWTAAKVDRYPAMDACRTYALGQMVGDLTLTGARVLGITPNSPGEGGNIRQVAGVAAAVAQALEGFYYFADGTPRTGNRNPITGTECRIALDNETDRGANPNTIYINNHRDTRAQIWKTDPGGARRYPRAALGIDLTQNNIRTGGSGTAFKVVAQYLDFFGCSMYAPGRQGHTNPGAANDNIVWSTYSSYIDAVIAVVQDWMLTGGPGGGPSPIKSFSTWEVGIPIDHPVRDYVSPTNTGHVNDAQHPYIGEPTDLTNFSIRPRYLCGGIDSTGKDWTGFLQYLYDALDAIGCIMREQLLWNQQSNPEIPNPLWHDQTSRAYDARQYGSGTGAIARYAGQTSHRATRADPDTETAWFAWQPGSRLLTATGNQ